MPFDPAGTPFYSGESGNISSLYRIYENIPGFSYAVWVKNTVAVDQAAMIRELKRITPAGISFTTDFTQADVLRYSSVIANKVPAGYGG